jgi:uncharacterized protein YjbI with pentapeptide repeats
VSDLDERGAASRPVEDSRSGEEFSRFDFSGSEFRDREIDGCVFQETYPQQISFAHSKFRDTLFHNADLQKASFREPPATPSIRARTR